MWESGKVGDVRASVEGRVAVDHSLDARRVGGRHHLWLVRYNPFEDTGSDQCFVIALLDDRRDGWRPHKPMH